MLARAREAKGGFETRPYEGSRGQSYLVALIENVCGNESLCSGKRHHPSSLFSMTGKAW